MGQEEAVGKVLRVKDKTFDAKLRTAAHRQHIRRLYVYIKE